ncbi:MAG TPA: hypothetical protein DCL21_01275 [Alphaproteobacteria bacterium]|nr:hypothetical protein [Alphaproteobacteria bacterium]
MYFIEQNYITLSLVLAFAISFFGAPSLVKFCAKVFKPENSIQRQHTTPTPTGGGMGFAPLIVLLSLPIVFVEFGSFDVSVFLLVMFICSILMALTGFLDDKHDLSARRRVVIQLALTTIPVLLLEQVWPGVPYILEKLALIIGWTWFVNTYNFTDGIDGYVSSHSVFVCLVGAFLVPIFAPLFLIIAAVMAGFLRVNLPIPRAKVFMGDVGSTFLGYVLGGLMYACLVVDGSYAFSFFTLVLLLACDTSQTIIKRIIRGEKPLMQAHREHWFARMYDLGFPHRKILGLGMLVNLAILVIILLCYDNVFRFASPVFGMIAFSALAFYIKKCEKDADVKVPGFCKTERYQEKEKVSGLKKDGVGQD